MSDVKQLLLAALNETDFPDSIKDFLAVVIPPPPEPPGSVDEAIIAIGACAKYETAILSACSGLSFIDLFLRAGQKNATLQTIALSGLELAKAANPHDFEIYSPNPNQEFTEGSEVLFGVEVKTKDPVDSVTCRLLKDEEEFSSFTLAYESNYRYVQKLATLEPDPYHAEITVTWVQDNYAQMQSVDFTVMEA